jgi:membrane protein required for colicin V production
MDISGFNFVDIAILAIFLISIIMGLGRGLLSEILSLLVLVAAFVVAILFTNSLTNYFTHTTTVQHMVNQANAAGTNASEPASLMLYAISFAILFLGTLIVGSIIKMLINLMLSIGVLGFGNRLLGGLFGIIRGYLFNLLLIFLIQLSPMSAQAWWKESTLVPYFLPQAAWLSSKVSPMLEDMKAKFDSEKNNDTQSNTSAAQP